MSEQDFSPEQLGISEMDWQQTPPSVRALVRVLQERLEKIEEQLRVGVQFLRHNPAITFNIRVVGIPISPFSVGESSKRPPHHTSLQTLWDGLPET